MINVAGVEEIGERLAARLLREAFAHFPSGVVAITGEVDGAPIGMAASSFTSVSLDPPLVGFFADRRGSTWPQLRPLGRVGVSVLGKQQDRLARQIASRHGDRFAGIELVRGPGGVPLLAGSTAWFECSIEDELPAGDHVLVLLRVLAMDADQRVDPLVFHRSEFKALGQPDA